MKERCEGISVKQDYYLSGISILGIVNVLFLNELLKIIIDWFGN